jgi:hypothetical protein
MTVAVASIVVIVTAGAAGAAIKSTIFTASTGQRIGFPAVDLVCGEGSQKGDAYNDTGAFLLCLRPNAGTHARWLEITRWHIYVSSADGSIFTFKIPRDP